MPESVSTSGELAGRVVVITGASDGIGRATAMACARAGARVEMIGRNDAKTAAAARAIMTETGNRTVSWDIADLSQQDEVRELAARLRARHAQIHVLVNNAGALFMERGETRDGLERTFALNHLNYFTLTMLLLPALVSAATPGAPSRVINVASRAHRDAKPRLDDLQMRERFAGWRAYANSKLYNVWFTRALATRLDAYRIVVHAVHPGVVSTRFATNNGRIGRWMRSLMDLRSVTPATGADTIVWLTNAADALATSGAYWVRRTITRPSRLALNDMMAESLWRQSTALAGCSADLLIAQAQAAHAVA